MISEINKENKIIFYHLKVLGYLVIMGANCC